MDIPCEFRENECPKYTKCAWYHEGNIGVSKCKSVIYCKNKNICSFSSIVKDGVSVIGESACNNDDECITNYCKKNDRYSNRCKRLNRAEISRNVIKYGLEDGETCWKASSCLSNKCILDKAFVGFCTKPSDSDGAYILFYLFCGIPLSIIGFCCYNCCKICYKPFSKFIYILSMLLFIICYRAIKSAI